MTFIAAIFRPCMPMTGSYFPREYVIVTPWTQLVCLIYSYTQSLRATGQRVEGVYIKQTTSAHGITNVYTSFIRVSTKKLQPLSLFCKSFIVFILGPITVNCGYEFCIKHELNIITGTHYQSVDNTHQRMSRN